MPLKKKNLLVCFLSDYVKTTAAGSYDMVILHCPNNLDPYTIDKCSCGHSVYRKRTWPWSIVYSIVHTDCVDFQFTQNIYCRYNLVVVEQLYPKSWGYLVFIALIYKKRKKSFIRHEFSF